MRSEATWSEPSETHNSAWFPFVQLRQTFQVSYLNFVLLQFRKYPNSDRAFGEPPLFSCTDSYKRVLEAHLAEAVAKISRSYEVRAIYARGEPPPRCAACVIGSWRKFKNPVAHGCNNELHVIHFEPIAGEMPSVDIVRPRCLFLPSVCTVHAESAVARQTSGTFI